MSNPFLQRRRRPVVRYLVLAAVGLVLFVVVGLVIQAARTPSGPEDFRPPAAVPPAGSVTGIDENGKELAGPLGPIEVVPGRTTVRDVQVGYPHSTLGAISASVQYWGQIASTLDPKRTSDIAAVVADPAWKTAAADLSKGPVNTRKGLGLATTGATPAGASVLLTPQAYQVRQVTADSVTVLLLGYYQTTLPGQDSENRVGVFPVQMHWTAGDWKLPAPTLGADYSDLRAAPGSAEATAKGWQPLNQ
jgi:hypothetical protein